MVWKACSVCSLLRTKSKSCRPAASDFARSKTTYWYDFKTFDDGVDNAAEKILNPEQAGGTGIFLGNIAATKPAPKELVEALNQSGAGKNAEGERISIQLACLKGGSYEPDPGDSIRLHKKDDTGRVSHKVHSVELEEDSDKRWIDIPGGFSVGDEVYLLQIKAGTTLVGRGKSNVFLAILKYACLALFILGCGTLFLWLLVDKAGMNKYLAKIIVEVTMFIISWLIQRLFVFRKGKKE